MIYICGAFFHNFCRKFFFFVFDKICKHLIMNRVENFKKQLLSNSLQSK